MEIDIERTLKDLQNDVQALSDAIQRLNELFHVKHDHLARLHTAIALAHNQDVLSDITMQEGGFPIFV